MKSITTNIIIITIIIVTNIIITTNTHSTHSLRKGCLVPNSQAEGNFCFPYQNQRDDGAHSNFYAMDTRGCFPAIKVTAL